MNDEILDVTDLTLKQKNPLCISVFEANLILLDT